MKALANQLAAGRLDFGFVLERLSSGSAGYRGVDRLPFDEKIDPQSAQEVWESYYESEETGRLFCDMATASYLKVELRRIGIEVEIVYVVVEEFPSAVRQFPHGALWNEVLDQNLRLLKERQPSLPGLPVGAEFLGFDVSHPVPSFHSALFQPGLETVMPDFRRYLNDHGLVPDKEVAHQLMTAANELDYGLVPFCVLGVWAV